MAPAKSSTKRKSRRKARTDVSSSSSSENESDSSRASPVAEVVAEKTGPSLLDGSANDKEHSSPQPVFTKRSVDPEQAFDDFYLRQTTAEFANDLDKLRSASDFGAKSVSILVGALKQGTACFSKDERVKVGSAASRDQG